MTTRELPPSEWWKLANTEAKDVWPHLKHGSTHVMVVEHEGQIVGCWLLLRMYHVECLWIAPEHQKKTSVGRRLWTGMQRLAGSLGIGAAWTAAMSDDVRALLTRAGATQLPGDHYVLPFRGGK